MADYVTEFFKQQQSPKGPIGTQGDQFGTPHYGNSPYAQPYQRGTNLPWSYQKNEPLPTWNGQRPVDAQGQTQVNPQAVPIQTGLPGKYGGNIEWFDPTTGRVTDEYGRTKDTQLTSAGPRAWQALAALAAGNPGGMLSTQDFVNAQRSAYGEPNPNQNAESAARKAAAGYPGYAGHPGYRAPTATVAPHWAQSRQQQAQRNAGTAQTMQSPAPAQGSPQGPSPANASSPTLALLSQLFQVLSAMNMGTPSTGTMGSASLDPQKLQTLLAALGL